MSSDEELDLEDEYIRVILCNSGDLLDLADLSRKPLTQLLTVKDRYPFFGYLCLSVTILGHVL